MPTIQNKNKLIYIASKRNSEERLKIKYPDALIIDVTSQSKSNFVKFSPFFPHGNIPVPFTENTLAASVEGIWQGLKVFEHEDIDISKFHINNMRGLKRNSKKLGKIIGHRKGVNGSEILNYTIARKEIYIPSYEYAMEHFLAAELSLLHSLSKENSIVFLDYNTNLNIEDESSPLSHAALIKRILDLG